jgi:hypothetical protein
MRAAKKTENSTYKMPNMYSAQSMDESKKNLLPFPKNVAIFATRMIY